MDDSVLSSAGTHKIIGIAADHGGFKLKVYLLSRLKEDGYEVIDFGNTILDENDDYPDFILPMALAIKEKSIGRGIAICGSGVGACIIANKISGVRACLIHESFSARQGVEDDAMNMICLGGRVIDEQLGWELTKTFLDANFSGLERHKRRLAKVKQAENGSE